jgi:predicted permease
MGLHTERVWQRRDHWGDAAEDLRHALRALGRDRAFAAIAVLILALGIGANTAVFSLVNTVLLRPLPFPEAGQLAWLQSGRSLSARVREAAGLSGTTYPVEVYEYIQRRTRSFQDVTSYNPFLGDSEYTLIGRGEPQPIAGVMVAGNFFQTLRVEPLVGRLFSPEECQKNGRPAALLSYSFWQRQFAGDPAVVGRAVQLGRKEAIVTGVLPPAFDFGSVFSPGLTVDVFVPLVMDDVRNWGNTLAVVARLKPGVSVTQAQAEADVLVRQLEVAHPEWAGRYASTVTGLGEFTSGKLRRPLMVLWCAVGLVLLLVCVNLSNLLLARAATRTGEFALRRALGATRGRLIRQLLTESLVVSAAGALLGWGLAVGLTTWLAHQRSIALPLLNGVRVDGASLTCLTLITAAAVVLFGLAPGLWVSGASLQDGLKDGGRAMSVGRRHERFRAGLVTSEVALACVLLIGAGLLLRSLLRVLDVDLGFQPSRAAVIKVAYDDGDDPARRGAILEEMVRAIAAIPGVESAGVADMLPLGRNRAWGFAAKGRVYSKDEVPAALVRIVTPGYLDAMGMRVRSGRDFTWRDSAASARVTIINQATASRHWPGQDPVGRTASVGGTDVQVIGVIADVREQSLEAAAGPEFYLPATQADPEGAELVIRTNVPPGAVASSVMRTLRTLNPGQPASELRGLEQIVDQAVSPRRFFVMLVTAFAALGLVLASLGIHGVVAYSVTQQTREIGVRMALGASARHVQFLVVARALRLAAVGLALGAAVELAAARWIGTLLFGVTPTDPATFGGIVVLLGAAALLAAYIPARRASRIDPMIALRSL